MWREIFSILKSPGLMSAAMNEAVDMLVKDSNMFNIAYETLRKKDNETLDFDIYDEDRKVNKLERDIRRKVLTHLTIYPADITSGLILISIIIDIERIGDYTKNIVELAVSHPARLYAKEIETDLQYIEQTIQKMFDNVISSMRNSDNELAKASMKKHSLAKECDQLLNRLIKNDQIIFSKGQAVIIALYVRYLKRIACHLINIATSMVNPFDRIGFSPKDKNTQILK